MNAIKIQKKLKIDSALNRKSKEIKPPFLSASWKRSSAVVLFFFLFLNLSLSFAQDSLFVDWARDLNLNQESYQKVEAVLGDDKSMYVVTMGSRFFDEFDQDEVQLYGTKQDIWITKYDSIGRRVWVQQIRDSANSVDTLVAIHQNTLLVSGSTNG